MSFGIAINRFSMFLEQARSTPSANPLTSAAQLGIGMVAIGMALLPSAAVRYVLILHHIEQQDFRPRPGKIPILTAGVGICARRRPLALH